jgi:hypothetical protein
VIIYDGPSVLDGSPIVVIATFDTSNQKTGDMVQIWILCRDMAPHHAVAMGLDSAVCGTCVHRRGNGGDCYVIPFQAPLAVYTAYQNDNYPEYEPGDLAGRPVRFGAYGDPAAVPFDAWRAVLSDCDLDGSTGYTHQMAHKNWDYRIAMFCQISADTPKMARAAWAKGYKTFRVTGDASRRMPGEIECLSDSDGISCADCKLCDGVSQNIVIAAHGSLSASVKQHDVIARAV